MSPLKQKHMQVWSIELNNHIKVLRSKGSQRNCYKYTVKWTTSFMKLLTWACFSRHWVFNHWPSLNSQPLFGSCPGPMAHSSLSGGTVGTSRKASGSSGYHWPGIWGNQMISQVEKGTFPNFFLTIILWLLLWVQFSFFYQDCVAINWLWINY